MGSNLFQLRKRVIVRVRNFPFMVAIVLAVLLCECSTLQAAPVTFQFEAEITSINRSPDATFDLPANAMIGGVFSGSLQFEPFDFGQSGEASSLKVHLGTEVFSAEGAPLTTQNNLTLALHPVGSAIIDSIGVGCSGSCTAVLSSSSNDLELAGLILSLSGVTEYEIGSGDGLITQGESLGDVDVWNRLSAARQLNLTFTSNTGSGRIWFGAAIGPMVAIPEPSSLVLLMLGAAGLAWKFL